MAAAPCAQLAAAAAGEGVVEAPTRYRTSIQGLSHEIIKIRAVEAAATARVAAAPCAQLAAAGEGVVAAPTRYLYRDCLMRSLK